MRTAFGALLSVMLLSSCASTPADPVEAPSPPAPAITASLPFLEPRTDLPVVRLQVGDKGVFSFIMDTGANTSAAYIGTYEALGATRIEGEEVLVRGLTGADERPAALLSGLTIGEDVYDDIHIAILKPRPKPPDVDGVLGTDVLQHYALKFDPEIDRVDFMPAATFDATPYLEWDQIPISHLEGSPLTRDLWFGRAPIVSRYVPVLIDTGADFSVMNWATAHLKNDLGAMYERMREDWEASGATGTFKPSLSIIVDRFQIGGHFWGAPRFFIFDLDALEPMVGEGQPLIIAGADMFTTRRYVIDFQGGMVYIDPNGPHLKYEQGAPEGAP